ncbi:putative PD-(D/E)XK family protein DUF4420 [Breznakia blatticola]|uniref:Putative PD-(D/E)XK family protein DUF4420 n=1 Tax=Breznakia blatticola TaxID=1754012 RepID=A0A4R8A3B8_9FIRM|nr:PD-(D/E)XK motif protein [Breznakia blatticola]TDW25063.1 putative PD-(D/E)XK family protein DUF4420 [Breznakia blatticola]
MNDISFDLKKNFANLYHNQALRIHADSDLEIWTIRTNKEYGIAVENFYEVEIDEKFNSVSLCSKKRIINNRDGSWLLLVTQEEGLREQFSSICAEFILNGIKYLKNGSFANPYAWWESWRQLLGDSIKTKRIYDVLGELICYENIYERNPNTTWFAETYGVNDIETNKGRYEVKSTVARYGSAVTISSEYQLDSKKTLKLLFCRFEKVDMNGISINDVLASNTFTEKHKVELEEKLGNLGYPKHMPERNIKFRLLSIMEYTIDDKFPRITKHSFKDDVYPKSISNIQYQIDLNGLNCRQIKTKWEE